MLAIVLILLGITIYTASMVLLFKDCRREYGSTMGGDMLTGFLWAIGSVLLAAGICLRQGIFILWAIPAAASLYIVGLPCRLATIRWGSRNGRASNSGFAEHIKRTQRPRGKEQDLPKS